jgi:hypothetical protein
LALFLFSAVLALPCALQAQKPRSETDARALERAATELKSLGGRGWEGAGGELKSMLEESWKMRLEEDENGLNRYMIAYANASAPDAEQALLEAVEKAREQMAGPMIMYFQSWNMAMQAQGKLTAEEAAAVEKAVNDSQDRITRAFIALQMAPAMQMVRTRRNAVEAHVRILHNQLALRELAREIIAERLMEKEAWSREVSLERLTYPK